MRKDTRGARFQRNIRSTLFPPLAFAIFFSLQIQSTKAQTAPKAPNVAAVPASPQSAPSSPAGALAASAKTSAVEPSTSAPETPRQRDRAERFYLAALSALTKGDTRAAEKDFAHAAAADPANREYPLDQQIVHQRAITEMIRNADKERILGHFQAARKDLMQAMTVDPHNPEVAQHLYDLTSLSEQSAGRDDATVTIAPPIALTPQAGLRSFHFRGTEQEVLRRVFGAYGVIPVLDESVGRNTVPFDADDVDFEHAAALASLATDSFYVPLDPKRVLVARDTKPNREQFDRLAEETLQMPGLSSDEMNDMGNIARNVFKVDKASVEASAESITLRAPTAVLSALNRTFADLIQARSAVLLDVRILEVSQTKITNVGLQLPQSVALFNLPSELNNILNQNQSLVQQIISSGLANANDLQAIAAVLIASGQVTGSVLNQPFALFGGGLTESGLAFSGVTANLALNSTDTRALDEIQLRLDDKEEGTLRSGTKYPIETSNYTNIGASSVSIPGLNTAGLSNTLAGLGVNLNSLSTAPPIPQVQYQDIGLTLKITPSIQPSGNVALNVVFTLTALEGSSINGLPVLSNQSYTANVVVGNGAGAMLMSDMSRAETQAVNGLPGLSELPGFQSATNDQAELDLSSLVIVITPHLLRRRITERAGPYIPLPRTGT